MQGEVKLDKKDHEIIRALFNRSRLDFDIADEVDLSNDEFDRREKKLRKNDVIRQYISVINPFKVGYTTPAYVFSMAYDNVSEAISVDVDEFRYGGEMTLDVVLGNFDVVHRRVDRSAVRQSRFTREAGATSKELEFFQSSETYTINQIFRWHGHSIADEYRTIAGNERVDLSPDEKEYLNFISKNAQADRQLIATRLGLTEDQVDVIADDVSSRIEGGSIVFDASQTRWNRALMGISLKPSSIALGDIVKRIEEMTRRDAGEVFAEPFNVPFIVSGIGQRWADILLELVVESMDETTLLAEKINNLIIDDEDVVRSTQTYAITQRNFSRPFVPFYDEDLRSR